MRGTSSCRRAISAAAAQPHRAAAPKVCPDFWQAALSSNLPGDKVARFRTEFTYTLDGWVGERLHEPDLSIEILNVESWRAVDRRRVLLGL